MGQWRRAKPRRVFACGAIIKVLPGLLLLHHHVWSPPRVLEVPLERVGQDLRHLCRSGERKLSHVTVSSEEAGVYKHIVFVAAASAGNEVGVK